MEGETEEDTDGGRDRGKKEVIKKGRKEGGREALIG